MRWSAFCSKFRFWKYSGTIWDDYDEKWIQGFLVITFQRCQSTPSTFMLRGVQMSHLLDWVDCLSSNEEWIFRVSTHTSTRRVSCGLRQPCWRTIDMVNGFHIFFGLHFFDYVNPSINTLVRAATGRAVDANQIDYLLHFQSQKSGYISSFYEE